MGEFWRADCQYQENEDTFLTYRPGRKIFCNGLKAELRQLIKVLCYHPPAFLYDAAVSNDAAVAIKDHSQTPICHRYTAPLIYKNNVKLVKPIVLSGPVPK